MAPKLREQLLDATPPPKLAFSSLPCHTPLAATPGALTPPLQPMVSIPFQWEEEPGRPRRSDVISPRNPKSSSIRCLELPPRMLLEAKVAKLTTTSPTTVLDGPKVGRSVSHRFCFEYPNPKGLMVTPEFGLDQGTGGGKSNELRNYFGPWRWADSGNGAKWDQAFGKGNFDISWNQNRSVRSDVSLEVKMRRFRRRTKGSLYRLSLKSSRLLENICEGLKQMVARRRKQGQRRTETRT